MENNGVEVKWEMEHRSNGVNHLLNNDDVQNPILTAVFARKLARFHNLDLPLTRNPRDVFGKIDALMKPYLEGSKEYVAAVETEPQFEADKKRALDFDIGAEVQWLKDQMPTIKRRRALTHGDMNRANCLVREDREDPYDKIMLIDYEFASYGSRGLDIGMHFSNRTMDVTQIQNGFKSGLEFPTIDERLHFIRAYKEEIRQMDAYELDESEGGLDSDLNMLIEANYYVLAFSMFFMLMIVGDYQKFETSGWHKLFNIFQMMAEMLDKYAVRKAELLEFQTKGLKQD